MSGIQVVEEYLWTNVTDHGIQAVQELLRELSPYQDQPLVTRETLRDFVRAGDVFLCLSNGYVMGFGRLQRGHGERAPEFHDIVLHKNWRGKRHSHVLLEELILRAKLHQYPYVDARVRSHRESLTALLKKKGFRLVEAGNPARYRLDLATHQSALH